MINNNFLLQFNKGVPGSKFVTENIRNNFARARENNPSSPIGYDALMLLDLYITYPYDNPVVNSKGAVISGDDFRNCQVYYLNKNGVSGVIAKTNKKINSKPEVIEDNCLSLFRSFENYMRSALDYYGEINFQPQFIE